MNRRQAITTALAAGTAVASANPSISTTQSFSLPAIPTPPGASEELIDFIRFNYQEHFEEFRRDVDSARDVFAKYPELVTSLEPHPDFERIAEEIESDDCECTVADAIMRRPDEIVPNAEEIVKARRENAAAKSLLEAEREAKEKAPKTHITQGELSVIYYGNRIYQLAIEDIQKAVAAGLPFQAGPLSIDLSRLDEPFVSIIEGVPAARR